MKKVILIPIIIGSVLLTAGSVVFGIALANSLSVSKSVTKTYEVSESFTNLDIDLDTDDLEFKVSDKTYVECVETEKEIHTVNVTNETLMIRNKDERGWYEKAFNWDLAKRKVTVYMPAGDYLKVNLKNSTGDITISKEYLFNELDVKVSTGDIIIQSSVKEAINVEASTGSITLSELEAKAINAKASTGRISLEKVNVKENISVNTSTGKISLKEVNAVNLNAKASTGHITLNNVIMSEKITIETSTGDIDFEDCDAASLKITTDTGDVKGTLLTSKIFYVDTSTGKVDVPHSSEGGLCEIKTSTGDVSIKIKQ